jgi:hypothetical protein
MIGAAKLTPEDAGSTLCFHVGRHWAGSVEYQSFG